MSGRTRRGNRKLDYLPIAGAPPTDASLGDTVETEHVTVGAKPVVMGKDMQITRYRLMIQFKPRLGKIV